MIARISHYLPSSAPDLLLWDDRCVRLRDMSAISEDPSVVRIGNFAAGPGPCPRCALLCRTGSVVRRRGHRAFKFKIAEAWWPSATAPSPPSLPSHRHRCVHRRLEQSPQTLHLHQSPRRTIANQNAETKTTSTLRGKSAACRSLLENHFLRFLETSHRSLTTPVEPLAPSCHATPNCRYPASPSPGTMNPNLFNLSSTFAVTTLTIGSLDLSK
jgi:hypothetical protein